MEISFEKSILTFKGAGVLYQDFLEIVYYLVVSDYIIEENYSYQKLFAK